MNEGTAQTQEWIKRNSRLKDQRYIWDTMWEDISLHTDPRKGGIIQRNYTPNNNREAQLYDVTSKLALQRAVAGYMAWTTSKTAPWFEFTPALSQRNLDPVKRWLRECSDLAAEYIAASNFYSSRHEALYDKWAFGTDCLFVQVKPNGETHFEQVRIGSYCFEVDSWGRVIRFFRETELTADQAKEKFGEENLPKCCQDALKNDSGRKFMFLHVTEPRPESERGDGAGYAIAKRKKFRSVYIEVSSQKLVQEGGFDSMPFFPGRFLKWDSVNGGTDVWGYGPGFTLLPEQRQQDFMAKMMDAYAEKSVFPPLMAPDNFEGALKTSPRATNYYPSGMAANAVFPLNVTGEWNVAMERMKRRENNINNAVFLDMFQMFSINAQRNREITAAEVYQLTSEKLDAISPAFDRDSTEVIEPMMLRCFEQWAELGMLPPPPEEAVEIVGNFVQFPNPTITLTGRLALALQQVKMMNADALVERVAALAPIDPSVLDTVDMRRYITMRAELGHVDPSIIRTPEQLAQIDAQRAQAAQAQQAAMLAKEGSAAVKNMGGIEQLQQLVG